MLSSLYYRYHKTRAVPGVLTTRRGRFRNSWSCWGMQTSADPLTRKSDSRGEEIEMTANSTDAIRRRIEPAVKELAGIHPFSGTAAQCYV
jgi:hypothetical protein